MAAIELARKLVEGHEGLRLVVYDDATGQPLRQGDTLQGHPTIGVGRNLAGRGISRDEAALLLQRDLIQALIDFAFQLGATRLAKFRATCTALRHEEYELAWGALLDSAWARQVPERARRIAGIVRSGKMP